MKKTILALLAVAMMTGTAFATYVAVQDGAVLGSTATPTLTVKGSKGVQIEYISEAVGGQGYVLGSYHASGTQTFGTSSGDTKVYKQDGTAKSVPSTAPTGSATVNFTGSGFTAM